MCNYQIEFLYVLCQIEDKFIKAQQDDIALSNQRKVSNLKLYYDLKNF